LIGDAYTVDLEWVVLLLLSDMMGGLRGRGKGL